MSNAADKYTENTLSGLFQRISTPVKLATLAGVGCFGLGGLTIIDREASHDAHDAVTSEINLRRDMRILRDVLQPAANAFDLSELDRIASVYLNDTDINALAVYGASGEKWMSFGDVEIFENDPDVAGILEASGGSFTRDEFVYMVLPFSHGADIDAKLLIRSQAVYGLSNAREGVLRPMLQNLLAALLVAFLVFHFSNKLHLPVGSLTSPLKRIKPGDADEALEDLMEIQPDLAESMAELVGRYEAAVFAHQHAAITDPASGLLNRISFMKLVDEKIEQYGERCVVLGLIDVNKFRRINDQIGVRRADDLLTQIGGRLRENVDVAERTLRPNEHMSAPILIGRLSGVQFGVLIPMADESLARDILQTISSGFVHPFSVDGKSVNLTVTTAAAASPRDAATGHDLIKQVETALMRAKEEKLNVPFFYNKDIADEASARMRFEEEVRRGVENGEFIAVFQPKVDIEQKRVIGAEALARWRRPDGSVVSPGRFIPVAEDLGLISRLGVSVLRDACREAAKWNMGDEKLCVAVNVSPHQFEDSDFIPAIYDTLEESGLPADHLELEITESVAVEDPDRVARVMRPLRARGVRLAIDDFGTGHSNFTTVTRLPFDVFKIDQQFVRALSTDPHAPAIIEMILAMAEALGLETVAEGVETVEQFDFLSKNVCTIGQGYYFSPPLPAHEFTTFLRHWKSNPGTTRLSGAA